MSVVLALVRAITEKPLLIVPPNSAGGALRPTLRYVGLASGVLLGGGGMATWAVGAEGAGLGGRHEGRGTDMLLGAHCCVCACVCVCAGRGELCVSGANELPMPMRCVSVIRATLGCIWTWTACVCP